MVKRFVLICVALHAGWLAGCSDEGGAGDGVGLVVQGCDADHTDLPYFDPEEVVDGCESLVSCRACTDVANRRAWLLESENDPQALLDIRRNSSHPDCGTISWKVTQVVAVEVVEGEDEGKAVSDATLDLFEECIKRRGIQ